jgi:hypothetical protein
VNGQQVWLVKYENDPHPGTVVYVDAGVDVEEAQSLLVSALAIERGDLLWLAPAPLHVRKRARREPDYVSGSPRFRVDWRI